jgi:hypothetical protein
MELGNPAKFGDRYIECEICKKTIAKTYEVAHNNTHNLFDVAPIEIEDDESHEMEMHEPIIVIEDSGDSEDDFADRDVVLISDEE